MVGLTSEPIPVVRSEHDPPQFYLRGFESTVGLNLPDLQNQWRRIAHDPRAHLVAAIRQTEEHMELLGLEEPGEVDDEDIERTEAEIYALRMFRVLLDNAVDNAKRPAPPMPTEAELDAALLALPGVTRVRRHGGGRVLRIMVNEDPQLDLKLDPLDAQYRKNEGLLHLARLAVEVVRRFEDPDRLSVHYEPGDLPDHYVLVEGLGSDGESPDPGPFPVHPGSAPTREWTTYAFKSPDNGIDFSEVGLHHEDKAKAIDEAWDHFAEVEASKEPAP